MIGGWKVKGDLLPPLLLRWCSWVVGDPVFGCALGWRGFVLCWERWGCSRLVGLSGNSGVLILG